MDRYIDTKIQVHVHKLCVVISRLFVSNVGRSLEICMDCGEQSTAVVNRLPHKMVDRLDSHGMPHSTVDRCVPFTVFWLWFISRAGILWSTTRWHQRNMQVKLMQTSLFAETFNMCSRFPAAPVWPLCGPCPRQKKQEELLCGLQCSVYPTEWFATCDMERYLGPGGARGFDC